MHYNLKPNATSQHPRAAISSKYFFSLFFLVEVPLTDISLTGKTSESCEGLTGSRTLEI